MAKSVRIVSNDSDGNEKIVIVRKPKHSQLVEAQLYSAKIFNKARESGACLRAKLSDYLKEQGIWTEENQKKADDLESQIDTKLTLLKTGKHEDGTKVKLTEGKEIAIEIRKLRFEYNLLLFKLREHDAYTIEGQAENARFDCLVSSCSFDEDGKRIFINIEDYYEKQDEPYAIAAASKLGNMYFGIDEDWQKKLPENEFLMKYKFVDNELRYINKEGHYVDVNGRLVDKDGFFINDKGERVDENGNLLIEEITAEFIDDR